MWSILTTRERLKALVEPPELSDFARGRKSPQKAGGGLLVKDTVSHAPSFFHRWLMLRPKAYRSHSSALIFASFFAFSSSSFISACSGCVSPLLPILFRLNSCIYYCRCCGLSARSFLWLLSHCCPCPAK
jgi:hypothetical protein